MKKRAVLIISLLVIAFIVYFVMQMFQKDTEISPSQNSSTTSSSISSEETKPVSLVVTDGNTVETRYQPPTGFQRTVLQQDSFGTYASKSSSHMARKHFIITGIVSQVKVFMIVSLMSILENRIYTNVPIRLCYYVQNICFSKSAMMKFNFIL